MTRISTFCLLLLSPAALLAQSAELSGLVSDPASAAIPNAAVELRSQDTGAVHQTKTNGDGLYSLPSLNPGTYLATVQANGFKTLTRDGIVLQVAQRARLDLTMELGSVEEKVSVSGDAPMINTTDAAVSTVIDRQFADNLPLNGSTFQSLIYLTPGVTLSSGAALGKAGTQLGQFSVNGQRGTSNYWMVDGVSANIGISPGYGPGPGAAGALGGTNVLGGTNSLVSVDALQEFRIQTSTYAPEFGRTPGGQISIVTRSGTNTFHGTAFDYLRNSALDATDWFADAEGLPKAQEQQNDFGGVVGGPIIKNKMFFFSSYEGLRLHLPATTLTTVPDLASRQNAVTAMQPFLNGFPLPNGPEIPSVPGAAQFNASFVDPASYDAYSQRVDYNPSTRLNVFGRYSYSPSTFSKRGGNLSLNSVNVTNQNTQTATVGATSTISGKTVNELRFNYSRSLGSIFANVDAFGGAAIAPLASVLPSGFAPSNSESILFIANGSMELASGKNSRNLMQQNNIVDALSMQEGTHSLKFGVDYRRQSTFHDLPRLQLEAVFSTVPDAEVGKEGLNVQAPSVGSTWLFQNLGLFAQDAWRIAPRLSLTYGVRWDIDFAPRTSSGPNFAAISGFSLMDSSHVALAPPGAPIYSARYGGFAPRIGIAYHLSQDPNWGRVLRAGFGVFYDLASSEVGNGPGGLNYPFSSIVFSPGLTYPYVGLAPASILPPGPTQGTLVGFDPHLNLPYTLEWNIAIEQALGPAQAISASYVGSAGRRLLASENIANPNANYADVSITANAAKSSYNALQLQFQRRLSHGLQALASYTWAHSIDDGSYGAYANGGISHLIANTGDSDFDVRRTSSLALTYNVVAPRLNAFADAILRGWSVENVLQSHSAPPVDIQDGHFAGTLFESTTSVIVRPDVVPGQPLYLHGSQYPGGNALNPNAFTDPIKDPTTGTPLRQGDLGRNVLRAFGLTQWDVAVHRDLSLREALKLQFRAEMFNVLNHPNFAPYNNTFGTDPYFGRSTQMLSQYSAGFVTSGGVSSLYNLGGPRSIQLALKVVF